MKTKMIIIITSILLCLDLISLFATKENQNQNISQPTKNEQTKKELTDTEFNDKLEYFAFHTKNRNKNVTSTNLDIINDEIKLCNKLSTEIQIFKNEYSLTKEQIQKLDDINNELNNINISYNTNKQKIKK